MTTHDRPHPLSSGQRVSLGAMRAAMGMLYGISRLRRRQIQGAIERRRYGALRAETLEIIHPPAKTEPPARSRLPIVYLHGGGWILGRKELYTSDLCFLGQRGHRTFNLDYPLAPEHPHPAPLMSLLRALAWLRSEQAPATAVHLMGDSAGGNLAAMLGILLGSPAKRAALHPSLEHLELPRAQSVISLYGVLDRQSWIGRGFPGAELMLHCYGGRGAFEERVGPELALTPLDFEASALPPCLLAIGSNDRLAESSRIAWRHLNREDGLSRLLEYEGESHGFFNMTWRENSRRLRSDIAQFLDAAEDQT